MKSSFRELAITTSLAVALLFGTSSAYAIILDSTNFPDPNFREYISELTGVSIGGSLKYVSGDVLVISVDNKNIYSLKGIEFFTGLERLSCKNNALTSIDLSRNSMLERLECEGNQLTSLDLSKNTSLRYLNCKENQLSSLDLSKNLEIKDLYCDNNNITSLDLSKNTKLQWLYCSGNPLGSLDVTKNTSLTLLSCGMNNLTSLDLTKNTKLEMFGCNGNQLISLDLSKNTSLAHLNCNENQLSSLDLSKNTALESLWCGDNKLTSLDLSKNTALSELRCYRNELTSLDLTNNTQLTYLGCSINSLTSLKLPQSGSQLKEINCYDNQLQSLDLANQANLEELYCFNNNLSTLDVSQNGLITRLSCTGNRLYYLWLPKDANLTFLHCKDNQLNCLNLDNYNNLNATISEVSPQISTRAFYKKDYNGKGCWALYGTYFNDASRIRNLKIDGESKEAKLAATYYLLVSDDLKKIPQKVEYEYNTGNSAVGWMEVTVNYDVKNYGVYIDGTELTSLNLYDIPALKSGTAYVEDEISGISYSGQPTLVLNNAKIEGKEGMLVDLANVFTIETTGKSEIKSTDEDGLYVDQFSKLTIAGGGTVSFIASNLNGVNVRDFSTLIIDGGSTAIFKGGAFGYYDESGELYIKDGSTLMAYGDSYPSAYLPSSGNQHFSSGIGVRYPVGAYIGGNNGTDVYYAGTTTKVQKDWVVIGPEGAVPPVNYDLNADGKVSTADIQVIINEMKKPQASQNMMYDLNADGKISTADIQVIINEMKK